MTSTAMAPGGPALVTMKGNAVGATTTVRTTMIPERVVKRTTNGSGAGATATTGMDTTAEKVAKTMRRENAVEPKTLRDSRRRRTTIGGRRGRPQTTSHGAKGGTPTATAGATSSRQRSRAADGSSSMAAGTTRTGNLGPALATGTRSPQTLGKMAGTIDGLCMTRAQESILHLAA